MARTLLSGGNSTPWEHEMLQKGRIEVVSAFIDPKLIHAGPYVYLKTGRFVIADPSNRRGTK